MGPDFKDHFSPVAAGYARFRPAYPPALFAELAAAAPARDLAWDCATGSGQAAVGLAAHFERVIATDASAEQIAQARACRGVEYRVAPAEASALPMRSVDLVAVAQAVHWFDRSAFYAEVRRVLRPGGVLALWGYGLNRLGDPELDGALQRLYRDTLGGFWPAERGWVEDEYRSLDFPFAALPLSPCAIEADLSLEAFAAYLRTWSAVQRFRTVHDRDPVADWELEVRPGWGAGLRRVTWPVFGRLGRQA